MKRRRMPGDIRLEDDDRQLPEKQPLPPGGRELVRRGYRLYEHFRSQLRAEHDEMRSARAMRQLRQDEKSGTAPASNTLNSCIDNVIADQIDNMPEAKLVPEREETANSAMTVRDAAEKLMERVEGLNRTADALGENMDSLKSEISVFKV